MAAAPGLGHYARTKKVSLLSSGPCRCPVQTVALKILNQCLLALIHTRGFRLLGAVKGLSSYSANRHWLEVFGVTVRIWHLQGPLDSSDTFLARPYTVDIPTWLLGAAARSSRSLRQPRYIHGPNARGLSHLDRVRHSGTSCATLGGDLAISRSPIVIGADLHPLVNCAVWEMPCSSSDLKQIVVSFSREVDCGDVPINIHYNVT